MISVTPVARGLVLPVLATVLGAVLVEYGVRHVHFLHSIHLALLAVVLGPCLVVAATRTWRWRSHKVHVTSQRIVVEGGVLHHQRSEVDLRDVVATHVDTRLRERLLHRGVVVLETRAGTINLGLVHHPNALCRLIDQQRLAHRDDDVALDTVFDFDSPQPPDYDINLRRRREGS